MTSIRSFLVHVKPGARALVSATLGREPGCDVYPSENADLVVVVSEHGTRDEEERFDERLASLDGVAGVALVCGYRDDGNTEGEPAGETRKAE